MDVVEAYAAMLQVLEDGALVATAGEINADIPTIDNFKHTFDGHQVKHLGFGCFKIKVGHGHVTFDGGGAMHRVYGASGWLFSWTTVNYRPSDCPIIQDYLTDCGFDRDRIITAITELQPVELTVL